MPRDGSGNYSLPTGNPVISGTLIGSSWANTTMDDLEASMTSSLDRQGRGGMLAPLRITDGSLAAPALGFTSQPDTGVFLAGPGDMQLVVAGATRSEHTSLVSNFIAELQEAGQRVYSPGNPPPTIDASVIVSDIEPVSPANGQLWFKSDTGRLLLWYMDADSNQWLEMGPAPGAEEQVPNIPPGPLVLQHIEAAGVNGGTATAGAWETRTINTTDGDDTHLLDLTNNQFTLAPGRYYVNAWLAASRVNQYQSRLWNITEGGLEQLGSSEFLDQNALSTGRSFVTGVFLVVNPAGEVFEFQSRVGSTRATVGYGDSASFDMQEYYIGATFYEVEDKP